MFIDDNDRSLSKYWYRWNKKRIDFDWHLYKKAFVNLHKCTKVAKYRDFQYRLLLGKVTLNAELTDWGILDDKSGHFVNQKKK